MLVEQIHHEFSDSGADTDSLKAVKEKFVGGICGNLCHNEPLTFLNVIILTSRDWLISSRDGAISGIWCGLCC